MFTLKNFIVKIDKTLKAYGHEFIIIFNYCITTLRITSIICLTIILNLML